MQRFYSKFVQNIFSPLTVYYKNKNSKKTVAALSKILNNWSILQQTGTMIREECFTSESIQFFMEVMYYSGCRDFYLVLRLIPDLSMKAAECVHMVKSLLDSTTSDGFARERAYIFEVLILIIINSLSNTSGKTVHDSVSKSGNWKEPLQ